MKTFTEQVDNYVKKHRAEIEELIEDDDEIIDLYGIIEEKITDIILDMSSKGYENEKSKLKDFNIKIGALLAIVNEKIHDIDDNTVKI